MNPASEVSRRAALRAGAAIVAAPGLITVHAAGGPVNYGVIGLGSYGTYLSFHLAQFDTGRCAALCDVDQAAMDHAGKLVTTNPKKYKDYRDLLGDTNVDAVVIVTPLHLHFQMTRDAVLAGKHVYCENSLVFKADEVHALRALAADHGKQILQVGLERRYSSYFQDVKKMIDGGVLGTVTHIQAQWHRNPGWTMKAGGKDNARNWRLFRDYSGGLAAELATHHIDVANWFFGASPEFVVGVGGLDYRKDGRDVFDNIQLIYNYPGGRKLTYSAISTCQHLPMLASQRPQEGLVVMGTAGAVELTFGVNEALPTALWFREPDPAEKNPGPQKGMPIMTPLTEVDWNNDSFLTREAKSARMWLYEKGLMLAQEESNPIDAQLASFLRDVRGGGRPRADLEVGLAASAAAILSNLAMDENRRVFFKEMETLGVAAPAPSVPPKPLSEP